MTLENWYNNKWIKQEKSSKAEINTLCLKIERDIKDSLNKKISLDWRLAMAYSALLSCSTIALRIFEYRVSEGANSHYYSIQSLRFTMKIPQEEISFLDSIRKKRHMVSYDSVGTISEKEVAEVIQFAQELYKKTISWIKKTYPEYL